MREIVAVLRGGPSQEYDISLQTGAQVLEALDREKYDPKDIYIDREGIWHAGGVPVTPEKALRGVDVAFNAMHGEYGEDGKVQRLLETLGVPYTGSGPEASALAFDKHRTKEVVKSLGIRVPHSIIVRPEENIEALAFDIFRSFPHSSIVKPVIGGSSKGTSLVDNFHALEGALTQAAAVSSRVLVEEFIKGREATVGVIDAFRNEDTYALMPVEIIPPPHRSFFDYDAKYSGETIERVPSHFSDMEKEELSNASKKIHEELGLSHYSRSDFIVSKRGIYFLEANTLPGLTKESLLPKALHAIGAKFSDFLDHVISLARKKKNNSVGV